VRALVDQVGLVVAAVKPTANQQGLVKRNETQAHQGLYA